MHLLYFLILSVFGLQQGFCTKCYTCVGNDRNDACVKFDKNKVPLKNCDLTGLEQTKKYVEENLRDTEISKLFVVDIHTQEPQLPMNCLKQVTKVGGQEVVLRGCQLAATENLDICFKVKEKNKDTIHTKYCSLCNSDGCNAAALKRPLQLGLVAILAALLYC